MSKTKMALIGTIAAVGFAALTFFGCTTKYVTKVFPKEEVFVDKDKVDWMLDMGIDWYNKGYQQGVNDTVEYIIEQFPEAELQVPEEYFDGGHIDLNGEEDNNDLYRN